MIINLANAVRLQGRKKDAEDLLNKHDWSGSSLELRLGVAAVKEDVTGVISLMKELGSKGKVKAEDYRTWPIFRGLRELNAFRKAFKSVFRENFIKAPDTVSVAEAADPMPVASKLTKH